MRRSRSRMAVALYVAGWLGAAAVVVAIAVAASGGGPNEVALPPVEATRLSQAAGLAGCELRQGEHLNPPASGAPGVAAAAPGFYEDAPSTASLVAALRRGVIVIHVRDGLDDERLDQLREIQEAAPNGTIVTPNETGMRFQIAATAYRHLLGCERLTDAALEALRLFRGRYLGTGAGGS